MCGIFGFVASHKASRNQLKRVTIELQALAKRRGRDGTDYLYGMAFNTMIGNTRAEPTTEYVKEKKPIDQQPYTMAPYSIVHNGTIANDGELRTNAFESAIDSAAIIEQWYETDDFVETVLKLKGSYAILAMDEGEEDCLFYACNYKPIWILKTNIGTLIASTEDSFPDRYLVDDKPVQLPPYSIGKIYSDFHHSWRLLPERNQRKTLVVCSGGLDSTVAAAVRKAEGDHVTLLHIGYGATPGGKERDAISKIAEHLDVEVIYKNLPIYDSSSSPLLKGDKIESGVSGAEFAHEWVPARNLVMLSLAVATAEAKGFNTICLGNNLEEAGAYPDNEPEFINKFSKMLPYAVADSYQLDIIQPVGNLMKHEIVKLGLEVAAPLHLTWSCYRDGDLHCGECGPCFMRKTAFEINNEKEVVDYEN